MAEPCKMGHDWDSNPAVGKGNEWCLCGLGNLGWLSCGR
ncbi:hypothetical protein GFS31_18770 [Leptolyngbya sp. BL0902]|nr:hypothetical protein GFS31_18770 [Leptolyngbya sp. BL0902]